MGVQLWILIQLQIHIWVVHFGLNFHCIDIMSTLCYFWSSTFCPITLFLVVRFEKIPSQTGVVFSRWSFWVQQPCVVLKIEHFVPYSVYLNIICFMSTEAIYFIFQGFILVALNDNLECTVFMLDLETFSKIKLICVPTQYYSGQFIFLLWTLFFFKLFHMYARYMYLRY